ncbi:MAG: hypothetical protein ACI89L_000899 [Phycisphaerales bacterium]|jgi:hypothetical protein
MNTQAAARYETPDAGGVIESYRQVFARQRLFAEHAFDQLDDTGFFKAPGDGLNSVAVIAQHIAGNLQSRWTDFLTTDGEKNTRNRDAEFELAEHTPESRAQIMKSWEHGWDCLLGTLDSLTDDDLNKAVTIRTVEHSVPLALARGTDHIAFHVGQINVLARLYVGSDAWAWFTLPPGGTKAFNERLRSEHDPSHEPPT